MAGTLQPLASQFPITNSDGTPTAYFVRWAQQRQIDISGGVTQDQVKTLIATALAALKVTANSPITVTGTIATGLTIGFAGLKLDDLLDVDTSTTPPTDGQALAWNDTKKLWVPETISGGGGGGGVLGHAQSNTPVTQGSDTSTPGSQIDSLNVSCTTASGFVKLSWSVYGQVASGGQKRLSVVIDGAPLYPAAGNICYDTIGTVDGSQCTAFVIVPVTAGVHTFQIYYLDLLAAASVTWVFRSMTVEQM